MPIDYDKYPADWTKRVERIRIRSKNHCEVCGLKNGKRVYSVPFDMREHYGKLYKVRYKTRRIWFRNMDDAYRECENRQAVKIVTVVLTVAHLDHDETNHAVKDERLKHMCQLCHLRYDAAEKFRRAINKGNANDKKGKPN
jgi:hypothetical protein